jgi:ribose 5-phosphate isomerase A
MRSLKQMAAQAAVEWIKKEMVVGLGAGATIAYLADALKEDAELAASVTLLSVSAPVTEQLQQHGFKIADVNSFSRIDLYFDSCDQLDYQLNAWKSGGGIHTAEKLLAAMADDFVLLADTPKVVPMLTADFPLVLEVFQEAVTRIKGAMSRQFPGVELAVRSTDMGGAVITARGNMLLEARFPVLPALQELNILKMLPGVVDHSLFYRMASKAIVAGYKGTEVLMADHAK